MDQILGLNLEARQLSFLQVALRGVVVFAFAVLMVRLSDKRFLSKKTTFDAILGFILASMLARAVNGSAPFWATIGGGFVLVGLHRMIAFLARHWHAVGFFVKGTSEPVIRNGVVLQPALKRNNLTEHDLLEGLRLNGHVENPVQVKAAFVERNGDISVVPR